MHLNGSRTERGDAKGGTFMARKRELIEPNPGDKRYVRRDEKGQFTESQVDVGRSLSDEAHNRGKETKNKVEKGQGDKGDNA